MKKQILVSIDDSYLDRIPILVEELRGKGLEVKHTMPALGVVSGAADEDTLGSLREVKGVAALEEERSVEIAPPDSPIQ